jgi:hypothetical protein
MGPEAAEVLAFVGSSPIYPVSRSAGPVPGARRPQIIFWDEVDQLAPEKEPNRPSSPEKLK